MKACEFDVNNISTNAFLLEGEDYYWTKNVIDKFISRVPEDAREYNLRVINEFRDYDIVRDNCETATMMMSDVVIVVKDINFTEKEKDHKELKSIIANLPEDYFLLFVNVKLTEASKKLFTRIDCSSADAFVLRKAIVQAVGKVKIESSAVDALIEFTNRDMGIILIEIEKLKSYTQGEPITREIVELMVANTVENEIFDLTNALAAQNKARAMQILNRFVAKGVKYSVILSSLTNQYRRMLHGAISQLSDVELASALGTKEYPIKKAREIGKKYTKARLKAILDMLVNAEIQNKTGEMSEESAFNNAIALIML